jgi:hypothetical protein
LYAKSLLASCAKKLFSNPTPHIEEALIVGVDPTYLKEIGLAYYQEGKVIVFRFNYRV